MAHQIKSLACSDKPSRTPPTCHHPKLSSNHLQSSSIHPGLCAGAGILPPAVSSSLATLFNLSLECGKVPKEWKATRVTPIPKGGDVELVNNYRPVSNWGKGYGEDCPLAIVFLSAGAIISHSLSEVTNQNCLPPVGNFWQNSCNRWAH